MISNSFTQDKKKKGRKKDWDEDELLDDIAAIANEGGEFKEITTEEPEEPAPVSKKVSLGLFVAFVGLGSKLYLFFV